MSTMTSDTENRGRQHLSRQRTSGRGRQEDLSPKSVQECIRVEIYRNTFCGRDLLTIRFPEILAVHRQFF